MDYFINNWLELFAVVTAIIYLYFSINRKAWLWILGILASGTYTVVFYRHSLYADSILNLYYVVISVWGWFKWTRNKEHYHKETHQVDIAVLNKNEIIKLTVFTLLLFLIIYFPIQYLPKMLDIKCASYPFSDSILTALSLVATFMLAKRYIEQWYIWMAVNGCYTVIYLFKGLHYTIILNIIYTAMSFVGYYKWKQELNNKNKQEQRENHVKKRYSFN